MGISAVGQGIQMSTVRHVIATLLVFIAVFYYFYGPPVTAMMSRGRPGRVQPAHRQQLPDLPLEWHSTTFNHLRPARTGSAATPRTGQERLIDLGWWVDL